MSSEFLRIRGPRQQQLQSVSPASPLTQSFGQEQRAVRQMDEDASDQDIVKTRQSQERAAEAGRRKWISQASQAGVETEVDPNTGLEDLKRHPDGRPVWKAGFTDVPKAGEDGKHTVPYRDPRGRTHNVPLDKISRSSDPTGQSFYEFDIETEDGASERIRRAEEASKPLFKVDPETGSRFSEVQDQTTGGMIRQPLGIDPPTAAKVAIDRRRKLLDRDQEQQRFQADELRLQQNVEETAFKPINEQFTAATQNAKRFTKGKRYADRPTGLVEISNLNGQDFEVPVGQDSVSISTARNWLAEKKTAEDALAKVRADYEPAKARLQQMQAERDKLALTALRYGHQSQMELAKLEEAAKAGEPVYLPEWQKRLSDARTDPNYTKIVTAGDYADRGSDLAESISAAPESSEAAETQQLLRNVDQVSRHTDSAPGVEGKPQPTLQEAILAGLTGGKAAPSSKDAPEVRSLALKSLGVKDPENWALEPQESGFVLRQSGKPGGQIVSVDPLRNRMVIDRSALLDDEGRAIAANASPGGLPVYFRSAHAPMSAQDLSKFVQTAVDIGRGSGSEAERDAKLNAAGVSPSGIRQKVLGGEISIQDGKWLNQKLFDIQEEDTSPEAIHEGFGRFLKSSRIEMSLWVKGSREEKAAVIGRYMRGVAGRANHGILLDRDVLARRHQEFLTTLLGKGALEAAGDFTKETFIPMAGVLGQAAAYPGQKLLKWAGYETEAGKLSEDQFEGSLKRAAAFKERMKSLGVTASLRDFAFGERHHDLAETMRPLREWASTADVGAEPPEELVKSIREAALYSYHELTEESARAVNTTANSFDVAKNPILRAALDRYLQTADPKAFAEMEGLLVLNEEDPRVQLEVMNYAQRPRAASAQDVLERLKPMGIDDLGEGAAGMLLHLSRSLDASKDPVQARSILAKAGKMLKLENPNETLEVLSMLTSQASDDPDSAIALLRGGFAANRAELATELVSTGIEAGAAWVSGGAALPVIAEERAARQIGKSAGRRLFSRAVRAPLDALAEDVSVLARGKGLLARARQKVGNELAKAEESFASAGIQSPKFGQPLTRGQRAQNFLVRAGKTAMAAAPSEALEEGASAIFEPDASLESTVEQMGLGALGGMVMAPAFAGGAGLANTFRARGASAQLQKYKETWVDKFNQSMATVPGFKPFTVADFDIAQGIMNSPVHASAVAEYKDALNELATVVESSAPGSAEEASPQLLAAQSRVQAATELLTSMSEAGLAAADELRALPAAEQPLFTGIGKAVAGAREFTNDEASALMKLGGENRVIFQQAQSLPTGQAGPTNLKTLSDLPNVTSVGGGRILLPEGVQLVVPESAILALSQRSPTLTSLLSRSTPEAPIQQAPRTPKPNKAPKRPATSGEPVAEQAQPSPIAKPAPEKTGNRTAAPASLRQLESIARRIVDGLVSTSPKLADIVQESETDAPYPTGGAWMDTNDRVRFHIPRIVHQLRGNTAAQAEAYISRLLDEEVRHAANLEAARRLHAEIGGDQDYAMWRAAYYGDIWKNQLTDAQRQAVLDAYGAEYLNSRTDEMKAFEALRMLSQLGSKRFGGTITESILNHLQAVLDVLIDMLAKPTEAIKREIANIQAILAEYGYEGDGRPHGIVNNTVTLSIWQPPAPKPFVSATTSPRLES